MNKTKGDKIKLILEVSKWEFNRWFKLKEQIITLFISALISFLFFGGQVLLEEFDDQKIEIAIINSHLLPIKFSNESKIIPLKKEQSELSSQIKLLEKNEIEGVLVLNSIDNMELTVNNDPAWLGELQEVLTLARQQIKFKELNISHEQFNSIFQQAKIKINYTETVKEKSSVSEKITVGIFIGLMLMGIFVGLSYQFLAITGEKQLRITEVIVSAINPQTWIDGKILGLSFLSLVLLITYSLSALVFILISTLFGSGWSLPLTVTNPILIIVLSLLAIGGFFFWNTFFTAIAATINDPNTSARTSLMIVPIIPISIAYFALDNPDSLSMKIFSIFPLTSPPVLSVRMVLTDVAFIEILFSLLLLFLSIWYLRKAAGKIFSISILMYGKEPSWGEILRWFKESRK